MLWNHLISRALKPHISRNAISCHPQSDFWKWVSLKLIFWMESWPFPPGLMGDSCLCFCLHPKHGSLSHCPSSHLSYPLLTELETLSWCVHLSSRAVRVRWRDLRAPTTPLPSISITLPPQSGTSSLSTSSWKGLVWWWELQSKSCLSVWFFDCFWTLALELIT